MARRVMLTEEEAKKRFKQILEYTVIGGNNLEEADDEQEGNQNNQMMGDEEEMGGAPMDGGMPNDPMGGGMPNDPMGGGAPMDGGMPNDPMGGGAPQGPEGFDPQVQQDAAPMGGNDPMMGGDMPMDGGMPEMGGDVPGPDDEEIDITEFTDSQKETEKEIEKMDTKFGKIMKMLGGFEELLRQNDKKIESLKTEFEKRNPTQIEKLGLQTVNSYPFNVTPEDFWKEKEATSNYSTESDNNGKEQGQYAITKDDLEGSVDWKGISDSLDDDDLIFNQTLKGVMGIK